MTNYREILRLGALEINKQDIAIACDCSRNTVANVLKSAECVHNLKRSSCTYVAAFPNKTNILLKLTSN